MSVSYPIYSIVPCCDFLGTQLDNFVGLSGPAPIGTVVYQGPEQTLNGIEFKPGYCYTITQVGFGLISGFQINFELFNQTPLPNCQPVECYCLILNGDAEYYGGAFTVTLTASGISNGKNFYSGVDDQNNTYKIEFQNDKWELFINNVLAASQSNNLNCPTESWVIESYLDSVSTQNGNCSCISCEKPSCYELTKCGENTPSIISNSTSLFEYYDNNKIVKLAGYEGCYTIDVAVDCDCAVSVTVTQSYDDCENCLPVVAYKFTNCDNRSLVQYSNNDYSEYVGKTVELECGGCWTVSEINVIPPSKQDPVIQTECNNTSENCLHDAIRVTYVLDGVTYTVDVPKVGVLNGRPRYQWGNIFINYSDGWFLFGLGGDYESSSTADTPSGLTWVGSGFDEPPTTESVQSEFGCVLVSYQNNQYQLIQSSLEIYAYANEGLVMLISLIDDLWTFEDGIYTATSPTLYSDDWEGLEGLTTTYCNCNCKEIVFNNCTDCKTNYYKLTNCADSEQIIYTSSQVSLSVITIKECSGCFIVESTRTPVNPITVTQLEVYTDCEDCLPTPSPTPASNFESLPKKFIRPGYSVPACDIEKYEKFACKSAEILYKQVLEKRYGISNCCPEGEYDQRWIIKKELADLQGLRDPNYICTPVNTCCNQAPSCNCH